MKHFLFTQARTLLFGSCFFISAYAAHAQQDEPYFQKYWQERTSKNAVDPYLGKPKAGTVELNTPPAQRNGACDLLVNGDFETQAGVPYRINNLGGGNGTTSPLEVVISSDLPDWQSATVGSPDYYATNASDASVRPATAVYGPFTPLPGSVGAVGLGSITVGGNLSERVSEYVTHTQTLTAGRYYAQFQVSLSQNNNVSTCGIANGFGLLVSNGPLSTGAGRDFIPLPAASHGLLSTMAITNTNAWNLVRGQFDVNAGDNTLTLGLFNSNRTNFLPLSRLDTVNRRTYLFVDDVQLFRIPTAGRSKPCTGTGVTIGEGCDIPGATYAWSPATGLSSTTSLTPTANPSTTTTYTLTVTLPDQTTYSTAVIVGACPPPTACAAPPRPQITLLDPNPCYAHQVSFEITNRDQAYSYTITAVGGGALPGVVPAANPAVAPGTLYPFPFRIKTGTPPNSSASFTVTATYTCPNGTTLSSSSSGTAYFSYCTEDRVSAPPTAYPNPATDVLNLPKGATNAVLLNSQGKTVQRPDATGQVDVHSLPAGLYNLQLQQDGKLINQHIEVKH